MNYAQVRAFFHVVDEGGVGRAARLMGVSQPTVSQHLKALEQRYGTRLFVKRGRRLELTAAGHELFTVTERFIRLADEVNDALERRGALSGGQLRLVSDAPAISVELLALFRRRHPFVEVSIRTASLRRIVTELREGAADVGITVEPPAGSDLFAAPLVTDPILLVVPADHAFAGRRSVALSDLADEAVILREQGSLTRSLTERALADAAVVPRERLEISGRATIREAVARGIGVSVFAESECPPDTRLAYVPIDPEGVRLEFDEHLVVRKMHRRVPAIAAFCEVAMDFAAARGIDLK